MQEQILYPDEYIHGKPESYEEASARTGEETYPGLYSLSAAYQIVGQSLHLQ